MKQQASEQLPVNASWEAGKDSAFVFFVKGEVSIDILEMVGAHCAAAIKNVSTLEFLGKSIRDLRHYKEAVSRDLDR